jgi:hypothetical protein
MQRDDKQMARWIADRLAPELRRRKMTVPPFPESVIPLYWAMAKNIKAFHETMIFMLDFREFVKTLPPPGKPARI